MPTTLPRTSRRNQSPGSGDRSRLVSSRGVRTRLASRAGEVMNESLCLELKNAIPVFVFIRGPTFFGNNTDAPRLCRRILESCPLISISSPRHLTLSAQQPDSALGTSDLFALVQAFLFGIFWSAVVREDTPDQPAKFAAWCGFIVRHISAAGPRSGRFAKPIASSSEIVSSAHGLGRAA
jgi:hypothetical protein